MKKILGFQQLARGTVVVAATNLLRSFKAFLLIPLLAKFLSAEEFGIWVQVETTLMLLLPLVLLGLDSSLVRFLSGENERERMAESFWTTIAAITSAGLMVALLCWAVAPITSQHLWGAKSGMPIVRWLGVLAMFQGVNQLVQRFFYSRQRISIYSALVIAGLTVELGLVATVLRMGYGVRGVVLAQILLALMFGFIGLYMVFRQVGRGRINLQKLRGLLAFGLPLMPSSYFYWLADSSDRFIIGRFHGSAEVGVYGLAYMLGNVPYTMLLAPLHFVLYPKLIAWWDEGKRDSVRSGLENLLRYSLILIIPAVVGLSLVAEPVILLMSTSDFKGGVVIVPWIGGAFVGMTLWVTGHYLLYMQKRTKVAAFAYGLAGLLNIALNLLFVPRWGTTAAAISTFIAYWGLALGGCFYVRRSFFFEMQSGTMFRVLLACTPMGLFLWWADPTGIGGLLVCTSAGVCLYAGALWMVGEIGAREVALVRSVLALPKRR